MRVLLHACCAPCASHATDVLREAGHEVTLFFSNGNIWPPEEYAKRLASIRHLAEETGVGVIEDEHAHDAWRQHVAGLEGAPEGGERCRHCFRFNLARALQRAQALGYERFTTSLSISPHKCTRTLFEVGLELDPVRFLPVDFKMNDGFRHSIDLSRRYGLYRQRFCGCEFGSQS